MPTKRTKHVPMRKCIACQAKRPKRELIRVVRTPDGAIEVDARGKQSGRGAYLCADCSCWDVALDERKLSKALKWHVSPEDIGRLRKRLESLVGEGESSGNKE